MSLENLRKDKQLFSHPEVKFGFPCLVIVDTEINSVSHSALVEIFYCMLLIENDPMSIIYISLDCIS